MKDDRPLAAPAAASGPGTVPASVPRRHCWPALLALAGGVGVSLGMFLLVKHEQEQRSKADFQKWVQLARAALEGGFDAHFDLLRSLESFAYSSREVSRQEFYRFTGDAWPGREGIKAMEWIPRVDDARREAHEAEMRNDVWRPFEIREWHPDGRFHPAKTDTEYFPIAYVVPIAAEPGRIGWNLASVPSYAKAMVRARNLDEPVAVPVEPFGPDAGKPGRLRAFLGIYPDGAPHTLRDQREINLGGYVCQEIDVAGLTDASLQSMGVTAAGNVSLRLFDVTVAERPERLYESSTWDGRRRMAARLEQFETLKAGQRQWRLVCRPTRGYLAGQQGWQPWVVLGVGLVFSGLLGTYLLGLSGRAVRIERLVHERTAALDRANQELREEIHQRERAEAALAQEKFLLECLMDTIPDHIYFKDRQSRFLRVNQAQADRFKLNDPGQAKGKTDFDFFTAEHAQAAFDDEQEIIRTGEPMIAREEKETWTDGSVSWVSTTKQCLRDSQGNAIGTFGISRDITARKLAQEKLRESEERLQSILDHTTAVIYMKDTQGRYLLVNRQFENLFHVTAPQVQGKTDHDIFPLGMAEVFRNNDLQVLKSPRPIQFEEVAPHDDGAHTYVSVKFRLCSADGAPYAVCGLSTDITARKRAEEALAHKTEELANSNRELELFAYVASHDLQEPLRMIASYTQLLARRYRGKLDRDADEFIQYAVSGAERMQTLINDLLAYSRVGTRGKPFAPTECVEVMRRALDNLKVAIEDNQAIIRHSPLPTVMADAVQMTQLFQNLLSNALKFRGDSRPVIEISAELRAASPQMSPAAFPASAATGGAEWVFAVRDNGIGIEPEFHDRIFVIFQRLHAREEYAGTGIGLAVCKKIVERHGGRIWVESQPGQGSTFYFTLPRPEDANL